MSKRLHFIQELGQEIILQTQLKDKVFKIAIDGTDGAGKSTFGDAMANYLKSQGMAIIRSSSDFFHNSRSVRYRLGRHSPEGYFLDSFNYPQLKKLLLEPLSQDPPQAYVDRYFDHRSDQVVQTLPQQVEGKAILVFDGIFLHRPELVQYWDYSIFLNVSRPESLRRCFVRDGNGSPNMDAPENRRYVVGQKLYLEQCQPMKLVSVVVNNEDWECPFVERRNLPKSE